MALWLLKVVDPYSPAYDVYSEKLIRAKRSVEARKMANEKTGDEGKIWEDVVKVSSKKIKEVGQDEIIIENFDAG